MVLLKMSLSDGLSGMLLHRGIRTFCVSTGNASRDSFSFRLSLEDRFHRTPAEGHSEFVRRVHVANVSH